MRSVAEDLRRDQFERYRRMTPAERVELARRLGEEGLAAFMNARQLDRAGAVRAIRHTRVLGRNPSVCMDQRNAR